MTEPRLEEDAIARALSTALSVSASAEMAGGASTVEQAGPVFIADANLSIPAWRSRARNSSNVRASQPSEETQDKAVLTTLFLAP